MAVFVKGGLAENSIHPGELQGASANFPTSNYVKNPFNSFQTNPMHVVDFGS